jgi:golgi to ER traffic protein 4
MIIFYSIFLVTSQILFSEDILTNEFCSFALGRWSSKFGEYPAGDPELHHAVGSLYAEEHVPYEAERHLVLGTKDSPELLVRLEYEWFKEDESHTAALYASRAILPYLLTANVRAANASYRLFTSALNQDKKDQLGVQDVSSGSADLRVYPSIPLLNYLGMLLLAIQRASPDLYRQLNTKYASHLKEMTIWAEALEMIAEMYFGISKPRQSNPLMDMMNGLLGGGMGGGGGGGGGQRRPAIQSPTSMPAAEGLD